MKDRKQYDGVWLEQFKYQAHEGRLYRHLSQPSRSLILERNAELRKDPGALRDLTFGRLALTIPLEDFEDLKAKYPDLACRDGSIRAAAWKKFLASPESKPYRVKG